MMAATVTSRDGGDTACGPSGQQTQANAHRFHGTANACRKTALSQVSRSVPGETAAMHPSRPIPGVAALHHAADRLQVPRPFARSAAFPPALALAVAAAFAAPAQSQTASAADPSSAEAALLARHGALSARLASNPFGRPLVLESTDSNSGISGNAYAVLDAPFSAVSSIFKSPDRWCDVLILHLNTKQCKAATAAGNSPSSIAVHIGRKKPQELQDATLLAFNYRLVSASPRYFSAQLNADKGPMGTSAYRIELQAVPVTDGKTFIHLRYAYGYNTASRIAMQAYLGTLGSGKIGFTPAAGTNGGYVGGMRGAIERNTMRYYLAIDTYLASLKLPPAQQPEARLSRWFDATEQYAPQLHEIDRASYIEMKKAELLRQQATGS